MYEETRVVCRIEIDKNSAEITTFQFGETRDQADGETKFQDFAETSTKLQGLETDTAAYGQELFKLLFDNRLAHFSFVKAEEEVERLRKESNAYAQVLIELKHENLRSLHWEYLCSLLGHPRKFAMEKDTFRLVRRLQGGDYPQPELPPLPQPPRALVVISNPDDLEEPRRAKEDPGHFGTAETSWWPRISSQTIHDLCERFEDFRRQNRISDYQIVGVPERDQNKFLDEFYPHPRDELKGKLFPAIYPSKERIREVLEEAVNQRDPHHIVHFLAHGYLDDDGKGRLVLTDEEGYAFSVRQDEFSHLFPANHSVRLVFFAACQSDDQALDRPLAGLAPLILDKSVRVPAVIAMQDEISVGAANLFTRAFYEALGRYGYIDTAVTIARDELANSSEYGHEWGIPVLYLQDKNHRLFVPPASSPNPVLAKLSFTVPPPETFVDRAEQLEDYPRILWEDVLGNPQICWLSGPQKVGKYTLLRQLRYMAYQAGYAHLTLAVTESLPMRKASETLYELLADDMLHPLGQLTAWKHLNKLSAGNPSTQNIDHFLDGLEELSSKLQRKVICFFYFVSDFEANRNFMFSPDGLSKLVSMVADRYGKGELKMVRFMFATNHRFERPQLLQGYFYPDELPGFSGLESVVELCKAYGLVRDGQVPGEILRLVREHTFANGQYLPGPVAGRIEFLSKRAKLRPEFLDSLEWETPNEAGGGR